MARIGTVATMETMRLLMSKPLFLFCNMTFGIAAIVLRRLGLCDALPYHHCITKE